MAAKSSLKPRANNGWTAGLRNMLQKENARWWNPKSLAVQLVLWLFILNSLVALTLFVLPGLVTDDVKQQIANSSDEQAIQIISDGQLDLTPEKIVELGKQMFFQVAGIAILIGGVIIGHDVILKERESGTAAWLLSKPLSRKAFVISKILANSVGLLAIVVLVQGIVAYWLCSITLGHPIAILPFLAGLGVLGLSSLFFMVLAIALGAFSLSRGVTLGVPILVGFVGGIVLQFVPELGYVMPWQLSSIAIMAANGISLPALAFAPIVCTALWILAFSGAAIWRFEHIEL